ncbi:helix-turn-helix domain-containing protein [Comamonas antarctica]|uniref:helix-turn-helix domain-containing protein n=1 Tax=Comamonas antarctica TaxID=2743470 RepID=UPI0028E65AE9|nr:helix-turn-helix domain-containing protein [Comamonas antarctica]
MSTIIMAACWPLQNMSPAQKAVLISLADQANDDGVCWPGIKTIAKRTCLSERAVQEAIGWLQTVGLVFRDYRLNTSTSYTITPSKFQPAAAPAKRSRATGANGAPGADGAPPADGAPGAFGAPPGADGAPGGADGAPPPVQMAHPRGADGAPKSSLNRKGNRKGNAKEPFPAAPQPALGAAGAGLGDDETALQAACKHTWAAYCQAYVQRYGVKPVRNAKVNDNVKALVKRLGYEEAPRVAAWYVERVSEAYVLKDSHGVGALLAKAESYHTQWARGQAVTGTAAQAADKTSANFDAIEQAKQMLRQRTGQSQGASNHA